MVRVIQPNDSGKIAVKVGTPKQIRDFLSAVKAPKVLAVTLPASDSEEANAVLLVVEKLLPLVHNHFRDSQATAFKTLVDLLTPDVPTKATVREAEMVARVRRTVLESGDWWTAADIAKHAGFSKTNPSAQPSKWKRDCQTFTITWKGTDYFPKYGLDEHRARPLPAMKDVILILSDKKDGWGMAVWFEAVNSYLGGKAPKTVIAKHPDRVIDAARNEVMAEEHA